MSDLIIAPAPGLVPAALFAPTPKAAKRVLEFFTAQVNNDHTRKAYQPYPCAQGRGAGTIGSG